MRLEAEVAQVCGVANAAAGRLVSLIADVLATGSWEGADILSPAHWVGWKCGVSPKRARRLVSMARRLPELPETRAAFEAGELSEDQVALICRHAPAVPTPRWPSSPATPPTASCRGCCPSTCSSPTRRPNPSPSGAGSTSATTTTAGGGAGEYWDQRRGPRSQRAMELERERLEAR